MKAIHASVLKKKITQLLTIRDQAVQLGPRGRSRMDDPTNWQSGTPSPFLKEPFHNLKMTPPVGVDTIVLGGGDTFTKKIPVRKRTKEKAKNFPNKFHEFFELEHRGEGRPPPKKTCQKWFLDD